jgi:hypothetical protein
MSGVDLKRRIAMRRPRTGAVRKRTHAAQRADKKAAPKDAAR